MNSVFQTDDIIAAIATPPGQGALGVIRVSGNGVFDLIHGIFKGRDFRNSKGFTLHYGYIEDRQESIDEVLLSVFRGPKSFTGEDVIELSCHGSSYILQRVLSLLLEKGCRLAEPGEFTRRAFMHGKMDLSQAEAVADLIASNSEISHRMAMQQMKGGFRNRIAQLRKKLIDFASLIELELDFGEEDVEFADRPQLTILVSDVIAVLNELFQSFKLGNVFKTGVYTVIAGRPNAGKSTLLNALLNEERAIVSEIAGTTRDTIEEMLNIKGLIFKLVDTAGIREATDQIEAIGVQRTFESIDRSALLVYVYDASVLSEEEVKQDLSKLSKPGIPVMVIANKADKISTHISIPEGSVKISAKHLSEEDLGNLKEALFNMAIDVSSVSSDVVVSNVRHAEALKTALDSMLKVSAGLKEGMTGDLLAFHLRDALHHLGLITGEVSTEDLLENIFRNFCIGK